MKKHRAEFTSYFWGHVAKAGDNECWLWTGQKNPDGYGQFTHRRETWRAHRFAAEAAGMDIRRCDLVRHTCDTPLCVNPKHLLPGTWRDNMRDMVARGRNRFVPRYGEAASRAKLTSEDVIAIRAVYDKHMQTNAKFPEQMKGALCDRFGIKRGQLRNIVLRLGWRHLP